MITVKGYLDNLEKCRYRGCVYQGGERASFYLYKGIYSIGYSVDFVEEVGMTLQLISFNLAQGNFWKKLADELKERLGEPDYENIIHGIKYFGWRVNDETIARA